MTELDADMQRESLDQYSNSKAAFYHLRLEKKWFRGKDAFSDRLFNYEKQLTDEDMVDLPLNAGNMIYVMLRRLQMGVEWEKQDALIGSYRNLMFKLSYACVRLFRDDYMFLHISGQKNDVMWALSFLSQVFPDTPLVCQTVISQDAIYDGEKPLVFAIQNGTYVGENAIQIAALNDALPDIWSIAAEDSSNTNIDEPVSDVPQYDPMHQPKNDEPFVLMDGRVANYVRMDERFQYADQYGTAINDTLRHNITASLIKDFQDLVHTQTGLDYEVYRMRYVAFMNKVHELEKLLGGLEISAYDILPIGERGLPFASEQTLERTNRLEQGSIYYLIDRVKASAGSLRPDEKRDLVREAGRSVIFRLKAYDMEYQMYVLSGSDAELCKSIHNNQCFTLYADFAELDCMNVLLFPKQVYKYLCNDPEISVYAMTEWEKIKLRIFGRGYADYVAYQIQELDNAEAVSMYRTALGFLESRYLRQQ